MTSRFADVLVFHKGHALRIPHELADYRKLRRGDDVGDLEIALIRQSLPSVANARAIRDCALKHTVAQPADGCPECGGSGHSRIGNNRKCCVCLDPYPHVRNRA